MKTCPACAVEVPDVGEDCPSCGVVLAKWKPRDERSRAAPALPHRTPPRPRRSVGKPVVRSQRHTLAVVLLGALVVLACAGYLYLTPRTSSGVAKSTRVSSSGSSFSDLGKELQLPGGPIGLAAAGSDLLVANRDDPWGFIRLRRNDARQLEVNRIPVIEPTYGQRVGFSAVTWNGEHFVAYTDGAWFQKQNEMVFTFHDPVTLQVLRHVSAPPGLGCIAWDGTGYWAATRKNTQFADESAWLYRLDESLQVVSTYEPPAVGCQGLAWDGVHLWFADVFSDDLFVLDVSSDLPVLLNTHSTPFDYLSGVTCVEGRIWLAEYGDDRLHRFDPGPTGPLDPPPTRAGLPAESLSSSTPLHEVPDIHGGGGVEEDEISVLLDKLRSLDHDEHSSARMQLQMKGIPIDYAWHQEMFPSERGPEDVEVSSWAIELRDGNLYGSWRIFFGEELFETDAESSSGVITLPLFARYTINVEGENLVEPIELEMEASPGENVQEDVLLASGLGPGKVSADIFVHVQFVDREGTARIFNTSSFSLEVEKR